VKKWLVTTDAAISQAQLSDKLTPLGCTVDTAYRPVPLGETEIVYGVLGPDDLADRLAGDDMVADVCPNEEMSFY
jgi:hypothetical protein